jgi:membrane associated rhomboid family serine protease
VSRPAHSVEAEGRAVLRVWQKVQARSLRGVVTPGLVAATVLAHGLQGLRARSLERIGSPWDPPELLVKVALGGGTLLTEAYGEWWRLVSGAWVHDGMLHLSVNMYVLWVLGRPMEQVLGPARMALLWTVAIVAGSWASLLTGVPVTVGASAGTAGLIGAHGMLLGSVWSRLSADQRRGLWRALGLTVLINAVLTLWVPSIDHAAHLGGRARVLVGASAVGARGQAPTGVDRRRVARPGPAWRRAVDHARCGPALPQDRVRVGAVLAGAGVGFQSLTGMPALALATRIG